MLIDMFCKSRAGGGAFEVGELVAGARAAHLDALCLADIDKSSHAYEVLDESDALDFPIFVGVEIRCSDGDVVCIPHEVDDDFVDEVWREDLGERPSVAEVVEYFTSTAAVIARNVYVSGHGLR